MKSHHAVAALTKIIACWHFQFLGKKNKIKKMWEWHVSLCDVWWSVSEIRSYFKTRSTAFRHTMKFWVWQSEEEVTHCLCCVNQWWVPLCQCIVRNDRCWVTILILTIDELKMYYFTLKSNKVNIYTHSRVTTTHKSQMMLKVSNIKHLFFFILFLFFYTELDNNSSDIKSYYNELSEFIFDEILIVAVGLH